MRRNGADEIADRHSHGKCFLGKCGEFDWLIIPIFNSDIGAGPAVQGNSGVVLNYLEGLAADLCQPL